MTIKTTTAPTETPDRAVEAPKKEKRRRGRSDVALKVRLYWQDDVGTILDAPGVVRNVSAGGFGVQLETGLAVSRLVTVRSEQGTSLQCVVRHRQGLSNGFLVGLEVLPTSDGMFHLSALNKLSDALRNPE